MHWMILVVSFIQNHCVTILLQASKVDHLIAKYFNWQSFFVIIYLAQVIYNQVHPLRTNYLAS